MWRMMLPTITLKIKKPCAILRKANDVIPLGFEPKTHALEGRCSNPTELRNQNRVQIYDFLSLFTKIWRVF